MNNIVFLSGKMTGLPDLGRSVFACWEKELRQMGFVVINPAMLPAELTREQCMPITLEMLKQADRIFMIPGWADSIGANQELEAAKEWGKIIMYGSDSE